MTSVFLMPLLTVLCCKGAESNGGGTPTGASSSVAAANKTDQNISSDPTITSDPRYQSVKRSWDSYVQTMITPQGMPIMEQGVQRTTSEAVSYSLLQAAILEDWQTFDKVLSWAENNLQRQDKLFGWEWKDGGMQGNGQDPASDGDQDIAAALSIAYNKTGNQAYKTKALAILNAIWQREVVTLSNGQPLMTAGAQEALYVTDLQGKKAFGVNPSYFRPTYYSSLFSNIDPTHQWQKLVESSYAYIEKAADTTTLHGPELGNQDDNAVVIAGTKNLTPDFFVVRPDGSIGDHPWHSRQDYNFGGDGWRTLYWMTMQANSNPADNRPQPRMPGHSLS